jgi:hypothetical protein
MLLSASGSGEILCGVAVSGALILASKLAHFLVHAWCSFRLQSGSISMFSAAA